jgi:hypothetical protein
LLKLLANSMLQMGAPIIWFCALRAWHGQAGAAVMLSTAAGRVWSGPGTPRFRQRWSNVAAMALL